MPGGKSRKTPAELVRELRAELSHDRFAAALGTSRHTVIRWEKGTIPKAYAEALAEYSGGRYAPEDFNPGLLSENLTLGARVTVLEHEVHDLRERIKLLERRRSRSK